jgi:hypothetical protein
MQLIEYTYFLQVAVSLIFYEARKKKKNKMRFVFFEQTNLLLDEIDESFNEVACCLIGDQGCQMVCFQTKDPKFG